MANTQLPYAPKQAEETNIKNGEQPFDRCLPFGFAEQHQVLLEGDTVLYCGALSAPIILELQRFLERKFELRKIDKVTFDRHLTQAYQSGDGAAQRAADELGAKMDLGRIADDLQQADGSFVKNEYIIKLEQYVSV